MTDESFAFGAFRLLPAARTLLKDEQICTPRQSSARPAGRTRRASGKTVSKDQLIASAWPETNVDEASLRVHVAALRKVLGDGRDGARFITNVPGRGYAFVAPVARIEHAEPVGGEIAMPRGNNIPASLTHIIGRDTVIQALSAQLARRRLLTILGSGGIGKTTTALAVVEAVRATFEDGVWFVALASVPTPDLLPSTLGGVFGIALADRDPISGLIAWLRDRRALVVLDNCEHLIELGGFARRGDHPVRTAHSLAGDQPRTAARSGRVATSARAARIPGGWKAGNGSQRADLSGGSVVHRARRRDRGRIRDHR